MSSKRRKHEEHENHERWLVSYADFITLLFAFFVVMYATSTNNEDKQKSFEEAVRAELKLGAGSMGQGRDTGTDQNIVPNLTNIIDGFPRRGGPEEIQDYIIRKINQNMTEAEKKNSIQSVTHDKYGARIRLSAANFFPSSSVKLKRNALETLNKLGAILKDSNRHIVIEGHADSEEVQDPQLASNWELASLRATSVVRYLIKYQGMDPETLSATSYADQRPIASNSNPEDRALNRRIEILILDEGAGN